MPRVEVAIELDTITCYLATCAITFAVPLNWQEQKLRDHTDWFCPNGHEQCYLSRSKEDKLRDELKKAKDAAEYHRKRGDRLEDDKGRLKRSLSAQRGVATRLRNKAIAGVCAFCARDFPNVAEHVKVEHPDEQLQEDPAEDDES